MRKYDDSYFLAGMKYGDWTVLKKPYKKDGKGRTLVLVRCSCGQEKELLPTTLVGGHSLKCKPCASALHRLTHGMSKTPEHKAWRHMKERCLNPKSKSYGRYGGRGITICDRWLNSFEDFYSDMGEKPEPKKDYSIERKRNEEGYSPENCIWANRKTQCRNRRSSRHVTINGESKTVAEWAEIAGLSAPMIGKRLRKGVVGRDLLLPSIRDSQKRSADLRLA